MKLPIVQQQNKSWVNGFFNNSGGLKVLLVCISLFAGASVQAHPHSWVDTKTVIQGSDSHISGFHMSWTFDVGLHRDQTYGNPFFFLCLFFL